VYSVGLITTNHPKRFEILRKAVDSIDVPPSVPKVMSVDIFPDIETDSEYFNQYTSAGWKVVYKKHTGKNSMATNQLCLLGQIETEWLLYCEDDITFREIPTPAAAEKLLTSKTGFISLNAHVHEFPTDTTIDYCIDESNYTEVEKYFLLKKDPVVFQKKWYFNFPSCFVRKTHLQQILNCANQKYSGSPYSIEEALSYAWNEIKGNEGYNNYIILNNKVTQRENALKEIHNSAILNYWDNDISTQVAPVNQKASMWF
tara:strand:- start:1559 stop:2332 length:774 start_codon:yes stop_codon:yes gene_type:complete